MGDLWKGGVALPMDGSDASLAAALGSPRIFACRVRLLTRSIDMWKRLPRILMIRPIKGKCAK
jgi:hypothetical protein